LGGGSIGLGLGTGHDGLPKLLDAIALFGIKSTDGADEIYHLMLNFFGQDLSGGTSQKESFD
jgi:hypothetical protein